ncbi:MAG: clostripain-related cysteine peptidase [Rikenellaceae bacterium]
MKNLLTWYTTITLLAIAIVFASCDKSHDETIDIDQTDYADHTIIMYGCGGGDLDDFLLLNLCEIEYFGYTENVNFTALVKFSESYQDQYPGTRQITLEQSGFTDVLYSDVAFELNDPSNIAQFILEAKERMPAKKYTLILWNHGGAISAYDLPYSTTKAICFDDYYENTAISILDLEDALEIAGGVDLVYFDACSMNMIENVYQLRDQTNYVLGSAHVTPAFGGNYIELLDALNNNEDIVDAIEVYIPKALNLWKTLSGESEGLDLTLIDVTCLEELVDYIAIYIDMLIELRGSYLNGSEQDELEFYYYNGDSSDYAREYFESQDEDSYHYYYSEGGILNTFPYSRYSVDLAYAFEQFSYLNEYNVVSTSIMVTYLMNKAIKAQSYVIEPSATMCNVSLGICWSSNEDYYTEKPNGARLADVYPLLDFEKATQWSRFIEGNYMRPVGIREELDIETGEYYNVYYEL